MAGLRCCGADDPFRARLPMFTRPRIGNPSNPQLCSMNSDTQYYCIVLILGSDRFGIRAGLPIGNPFYWSMLSLVFVKTIFKLKLCCKNLLRILFTPYLVSLHL